MGITVVKWLIGALIGALIGYCTNYIAVKMLFRPRKAVYVFGHKLPFTPGAIPKEKHRIAKAVGNAVSNNLLTDEDLQKHLMSEKMEEGITEKIVNFLHQNVRTSVYNLFDNDGQRYEKNREKLCASLSDVFLKSAKEIGIGDIVAREGSEYIMQKVRGTMIEMFMSASTVSMLAATVGEEIDKYIESSGENLIYPILDQKVSDVENSTYYDLLCSAGMDEEALLRTIKNIYRKAINSGVKSIVSDIDISGIVEEKINAMSFDELEELVFSVMKKELDTIVNLGALIGFIIGSVNVLL